MKNFKLFLIVTAVSVGLLLSGQPVVKAGDTLTTWPIEDSAKGDRSSGTLTIYYQGVEQPCDSGGISVEMYFFLRLYEKKTKTWHIISDVAPGPFCLVLDVDTGKQQTALLNFFNTTVLSTLDPTQGYTAVVLKDVDDNFNNVVSATYPNCVVADIVLVAQ